MEILLELESKLRQACENCKSDTISFSGGLDSTIIGYNLRKKKPEGVTIVTKDFGGTDLIFSQLAAKEFGLPLSVIKVDTFEILKAIEETICILKNFNDIEIRNNVVMYMAIKWVKSQGKDSLITGDGADELLAGYHFLENKKDVELKKELERIFSIMHFPTQKIGKALGVNVESPYLDENFVEFARRIPTSFLVKKENGIKYGKWILRKTYEGKIPEQITWREKSPMQDGSGTSQLTEFFNKLISDEQFFKKQEKVKNDFNITVRSKESMHYFEIFKKFFAVNQSQENSCPYCRSKIENSKFCRMCGAFPV